MKRTSKILKGVTWNKTGPRRKHNKHKSWVDVDRVVLERGGPSCGPVSPADFGQVGDHMGTTCHQGRTSEISCGVGFVFAAEAGWVWVGFFFLLRRSHELESSPPRFWLAIESGLISPFWTNSNPIVGRHSHIPCPHEMVHFVPHDFFSLQALWW